MQITINEDGSTTYTNNDTVVTVYMPHKTITEPVVISRACPVGCAEEKELFKIQLEEERKRVKELETELLAYRSKLQLSKGYLQDWVNIARTVNQSNKLSGITQTTEHFLDIVNVFIDRLTP